MSLTTNAFRFALAAAALCSVASTADAKPRRLVILDFDGPRGFADSGREAVVQVLGDQYDVVAKNRWDDARAKAQAKTAGPAAWSKAAKSSGVDAVISGIISDDGRHRNLTVTVTEAATGRDIDHITVRLGTKGLSTQNRGKLAEDLDGMLSYIDGGTEPLSSSTPLIETRRPIGSKTRADKEAALAAKTSTDEATDEDETVPAKKKKTRVIEESGDIEVAEADETDEEAPVVKKKKKAPPAEVAALDTEQRENTDLVTLFGATTEEGKVIDPLASHTPVATPRFRIAGGIYYGNRSYNVGAEQQDNITPYAAPSKGLEINAAIYPFPIKKFDGELSGIGFSLDVQKSAGSEVTFDDGDTVGEYVINQSAYKAGVHYRQPLGEMISVDGEVAYGHSTYKLPDAPTTFEVPDTDYSYLGAGGKIDLNVAHKASVGFGFRYMYVLDTGDQSSVEWYGPGRASGYGLNADFVVPLPKELYIRGAIAWDKYKVELDGVGQITEDEDAYETTDSTINGSVNVGINF